MSNEREMLEFAAKACGLFDRGEWFDTTDGPVFVVGNNPFDPKDNSADCAAMCAKLEIDTMWFRDQVECEAHPVQDNSFGSIYSQFNNDREAAWRFAACKVAEAIGRAMK